MEARGAAAKEDGGTECDAITDEALKTFENAAQRRSGARGRTFGAELRLELALEVLFDGGIESKHFEFAVIAQERVDERTAQGLTDGFDESDLGLVDGSGFEKCLENGGKIADGNLFAKQLLEDALYFAEGKETREEFVDELWLSFGEGVEKALGFLASEKLVCELANNFGEMRGENGRLIDNGVAGRESLFLQAGNNPHRGGAKSGLFGGDAVDGRGGRLGADGKEALLLHFPTSDFDAAEEDHVFAGLELEIVGDVNGGDEETQLESEMAAKGANALEQLAALGLIDKRNEGVTHFEADFIELQEAFDLLLGVGLFLVGDEFGSFYVADAVLGSERSQVGGERGEQEERKLGQARNQAESKHYARGDAQRHLATEELAPEFDADGGTTRGASDYHAASHGNEERGYQGDQTVAHGKDGVGLCGLCEWNVQLKNADEKTSDDVDGGDKDCS